MNTILIRLGYGFALACVVGVLSGCAGRPLHPMTKPSHADFDIAFMPADAPHPTSMIITPDGGDAWLLVVKAPGSKDNKIIWRSKQTFKIKFVQIDDQTQPLKPGKELGDEAKDWNFALDNDKDGVWEYKLKLKQGSGHDTVTVAAKYIVRSDAHNIELDPVIIVGR